jgi:hypothetical protein
MNRKKKRHTDSEKQELISSLVIMNDAMFEVMCEDPLFIEELLQTIFNNAELKNKPDSLIAQKSIRNLAGRSIRMDAYVIGEEDNVFNIEIQRSMNCNHVKKVRFHASVITANNSEPGDSFDHVQTLCIIYISEFDIFRKGRTIYHAQNTILETGSVVDNGLTEIYVNTEIKDGSKISDLMTLFQKKQLTVADKDKFPNTYNKFTHVKNSIKEDGYMKDEFAAFVRREGIYEAIETYDECGLDQKETIERIMKRYDLTREQAEQYYSDVFIVS